MEKHQRTEVSIPEFLVKFWSTEKFCDSFKKSWKKFCRIVKVKSNTWKKTEKIFKSLQKNLGRSFEEI